METKYEIDEAIKACDEIQTSEVYGENVKRVLRNTKPILVQMGRPRKNPIQIDDQGREFFEEVVTAQGNTGRLYPPKSWIGKRVLCICLD